MLKYIFVVQDNLRGFFRSIFGVIEFNFPSLCRR